MKNKRRYIIWGVLLSLVSWNVSAGQVVDGKTFCESAKNPAFFKARARDLSSHLDVTNRGGLLNGGVCWWHSLFQRAALYLAVFNPTKPKPNLEMASQIIHFLAVGKRVVEIPGYLDMATFSVDHWPEIQKTLERWQKTDGFLKQFWLVDISKRPAILPDQLKARMDRLFFEVEGKQNISWVMLKVQGIGSHAWLVVDMAKTEWGYELQVIDSNTSGLMMNAVYKNGTRSLDTRYGPVVPYLGRLGDLRKFKIAQEQFCSGDGTSDTSPILDNSLSGSL